MLGLYLIVILTKFHFNTYVCNCVQGPALRSQKFDKGWREKYCRQLITSLSASRLAKSICAQFHARIMDSHETFLLAIKQLENRHSGRLKETEGQREIIRKVSRTCSCRG